MSDKKQSAGQLALKNKGKWSKSAERGAAPFGDLDVRRAIKAKRGLQADEQHDNKYKVPK